MGKEEAVLIVDLEDNLGNQTTRTWVVSHFAMFSVPGAVVSVNGDILMFNTDILIDSYDSDTGAQATGRGDVISRYDITINASPEINGELHDHTDTGLKEIPVYPSATVIDNLIVNSGQEATLEQGEYYIKNLIVNSNGTLNVRGGWVKLWVDSFTIDGTVDVDNVKHLWMVGAGASQWMNINGNANFTGILYSPKSTVNINGSVDGSVIGKSVTVDSGATVLYDEQSVIHTRWKDSN